MLDTRMKLHQLLQNCSFFLIKLAAVQASGAARVKLRQNGTVSFLIRLDAFQTGGWAGICLLTSDILFLFSDLCHLKTPCLIHPDFPILFPPLIHL